MTAVAVHFRVDGGWLTEFVWDLVREGKSQHALRILEDIHGMSHAEILGVLRGERRLTGMAPVGAEGGDLRMAETDSEAAAEHRAWLREHWGRIHAPEGLANGGWEPYGVVVQWGPKDAAWASSHVDKQDRVTGRVNKRWSDLRSLFYAKDPSRDRVIVVDHRAILFRLAHADVPAWVPRDWLAKSAEEAVSGLALREFNARDWDGYVPERLVGHGPEEDEEEDELDGRFLLGQQRENVLDRALSEPEALLDRYVETMRELDDGKEEDRLAQIRAEVLSQAATSPLGSFVLTVERPPGDDRPTSYTVARAPFRRWVIRKPFGDPPSADDPRAPWNTISPMGLKQFMDNRDHSDWMIGAGIPLDALAGFGRDVPLSEAVARAQAVEYALFEVGAHFVPLTPSAGRAEGVVVHADVNQVLEPGSIVVVPRADVDYYIPAHSGSRGGGAVITALGGQMSHLAVVGIEQQIRLALFPDAVTRLPAGTRVRIDFDARSIRVLEPDEEAP